MMRTDSFDSLEAFLNATTSKFDDEGERQSLYDYTSFEKAKDLARRGWPDGLKQIEKFASKLEQVTSKFIAKQDMVYDVAGLDFDITSVVNGEPECWYDFSPKEEQKVVSILYCVSVSGMLSKEIMQLRGAAICSLIDLLEANNIRVELDVYMECRYDHKHDIMTKVRIKDAGQQLDLDRVAFCLMHAGFARMLSFSYYKTVLGYHSDSIGWPSAEIDTTGYELVVKRGYSDFAEFKNIAATIAWIKKTLKDFGVHIEV